MKKIVAVASVFMVLVLTLMIPISAADTVYYSARNIVSSSGINDVSLYSYPTTFDALQPGTRFSGVFSYVAPFSTTSGADSRFMFSFLRTNYASGSSVFIDCYPRSWSREWQYDGGYHMLIRIGVFIAGYGNIILATARAPYGSVPVSFDAFVSGSDRSHSTIRPEDVSFYYTYNSLTYAADFNVSTLAAADRQRYESFIADLAYSSGMDYDYNGTYDFRYHLRADYWSYELSLIVDKDQQYLDLRDAEITITDKDAEINRLQQIADAYDRYMEMTDQGEKSIFAGFIDSIGSTLWTGISMIFAIQVFDFTLGQIVAGMGFIAVLYVILKLVSGGGVGK